MIKKWALFLCGMIIGCYTAKSQDFQSVTKKEIQVLVEKTADSLAYYYVNLEMGIQIGQHIKEKEKAGEFEHIKHPDSLAKALTQALRTINGDLHLYVLHRPLSKQKKTKPNKINTQSQRTNYGLRELKILDNNIGYLKIESFSNWDYFEKTKTVMANAMQFLENTDAIIFDVRGNRGGVPYLVAYLISYLFDGERVHLAQYTHRYQNSGYGLYTYENVPGKKRPKVPVYVLVDERSASAAEEFAYFLKHQKRATIIGDTTAGAGYGTMWHRLNNRFIVSISSEEDINPITKTNFEKVGVLPNIPTSNEEAMQVAQNLAEKAGKVYRSAKNKEHQQLLVRWDTLSKKSASSDIETLLQQVHQEGLINRNEINQKGYEFLESAPKIAEIIFKMNTQFYPDISNVYDSYGDALVANNKLENALINYEKAVAIGTKNKSRNVPIYQVNVEKVKNLLAGKK